MRAKRLIALVALTLPALGALGCGGSDPVAAQASSTPGGVQVAPEAKQGAEGAIKAQQENEKRQREADKKAGIK